MQSTRLQSADAPVVIRETEQVHESLAERLASGPLPLPVALRYAADISTALRALHYDGRAHGWVNPAAVELEHSRAVLTGGITSRQNNLRNDIESFGSMLFEMINGRKTGPDVPLPVVPCTIPRTGMEGLKMAANRLASRCLSDETLSIQKVATEVRLLKVLARQLPPPPPPAPTELPVALPAGDVAQEPAETADATGEPEHKRERVAEDPVTGTPLCPRCGSSHIYTAKPRTGFEEWLLRVRKPVHRCHRCYYRYVVLFGFNFNKSTPSDKSVKA